MPRHEHPAEFGSINCCPGCHPRFCDCQEPRPLAEPMRDPCIRPNLDRQEARAEGEERQDQSVVLDFKGLDDVSDLSGRVHLYNEKGRLVATIRGHVEYARPGLRVVRQPERPKSMSGEEEAEGLLEGDGGEGVF